MAESRESEGKLRLSVSCGRAGASTEGRKEGREGGSQRQPCTAALLLATAAAAAAMTSQQSNRPARSLLVNCRPRSVRLSFGNDRVLCKNG